MASITSPRLNNTIRTDVPAINAILKALAKADPSILSDIENGTKRFYEGTSGWEFQELINGAWTTHTNFNIDAQSVDGFNTSVDAVASTIVVRGTDGKLKGNLTGKADTAGTADKLASTLAVTAGGTGATSVADARTNLGVPPTNHKSTTTNYGVSSATEYGHSMAGSATPKPDTENGTVGVDVTHFSRQDHAHPITKGTTSTVGAVTLKDTYTGNETASTSTGISPKGVQVAVDDLHTATIEAVEQVTANSNGSSGGDASFDDVISEVTFLNSEVNRLAELANQALAKESVLPGSVIAWAANTTPNGYLLCNGAAVSRTTYAALFAAIGTIYGTGDGSSTFNLPNLTDRFIQGSGTAGTVKAAGLPNITGTLWGAIRKYAVSSTGCFVFRDPGGSTNTTDNEGDNVAKGVVDFYANRSSSVYGSSSTVQPPALTMRYYIKY